MLSGMLVLGGDCPSVANEGRGGGKKDRWWIYCIRWIKRDNYIERVDMDVMRLEVFVCGREGGRLEDISGDTLKSTEFC